MGINWNDYLENYVRASSFSQGMAGIKNDNPYDEIDAINRKKQAAGGGLLAAYMGGAAPAAQAQNPLSPSKVYPTSNPTPDTLVPKGADKSSFWDMFKSTPLDFLWPVTVATRGMQKLDKSTEGSGVNAVVHPLADFFTGVNKVATKDLINLGVLAADKASWGFRTPGSNVDKIFTGKNRQAIVEGLSPETVREDKLTGSLGQGVGEFAGNIGMVLATAGAGAASTTANAATKLPSVLKFLPAATNAERQAFALAGGLNALTRNAEAVNKGQMGLASYLTTAPLEGAANALTAGAYEGAEGILGAARAMLGNFAVNAGAGALGAIPAVAAGEMSLGDAAKLSAMAGGIGSVAPALGKLGSNILKRGELPSQGAELPSQGTELPSQGAGVPAQAVDEVAPVDQQIVHDIKPNTVPTEVTKTSAGKPEDADYIDAATILTGKPITSTEEASAVISATYYTQEGLVPPSLVSRAGTGKPEGVNDLLIAKQIPETKANEVAATVERNSYLNALMREYEGDNPEKNLRLLSTALELNFKSTEPVTQQTVKEKVLREWLQQPTKGGITGVEATLATKGLDPILPKLKETMDAKAQELQAQQVVQQASQPEAATPGDVTTPVQEGAVDAASGVPAPPPDAPVVPTAVSAASLAPLEPADASQVIERYVKSVSDGNYDYGDELVQRLLHSGRVETRLPGNTPIGATSGFDTLSQLIGAPYMEIRRAIVEGRGAADFRGGMIRVTKEPGSDGTYAIEIAPEAQDMLQQEFRKVEDLPIHVGSMRNDVPLGDEMDAVVPPRDLHEGDAEYWVKPREGSEPFEAPKEQALTTERHITDIDPDLSAEPPQATRLRARIVDYAYDAKTKTMSGGTARLRDNLAELFNTGTLTTQLQKGRPIAGMVEALVDDTMVNIKAEIKAKGVYEKDGIRIENVASEKGAPKQKITVVDDNLTKTLAEINNPTSVEALSETALGGGDLGVGYDDALHYQGIDSEGRFVTTERPLEIIGDQVGMARLRDLYSPGFKALGTTDEDVTSILKTIAAEKPLDPQQTALLGSFYARANDDAAEAFSQAIVSTREAMEQAGRIGTAEQAGMDVSNERIVQAQNNLSERTSKPSGQRKLPPSGQLNSAAHGLVGIFGGSVLPEMADEQIDDNEMYGPFSGSTIKAAIHALGGLVAVSSGIHGVRSIATARNAGLRWTGGFMSGSKMRSYLKGRDLPPDMTVPLAQKARISALREGLQEGTPEYADRVRALVDYGAQADKGISSLARIDFLAEVNPIIKNVYAKSLRVAEQWSRRLKSEVESLNDEWKKTYTQDEKHAAYAAAAEIDDRITAIRNRDYTEPKDPILASTKMKYDEETAARLQEEDRLALIKEVTDKWLGGSASKEKAFKELRLIQDRLSSYHLKALISDKYAIPVSRSVEDESLFNEVRGKLATLNNATLELLAARKAAVAQKAPAIEVEKYDKMLEANAEAFRSLSRVAKAQDEYVQAAQESSRWHYVHRWHDKDGEWVVRVTPSKDNPGVVDARYVYASQKDARKKAAELLAQNPANAKNVSVMDYGRFRNKTRVSRDVIDRVVDAATEHGLLQYGVPDALNDNQIVDAIDALAETGIDKESFKAVIAELKKQTGGQLTSASLKRLLAVSQEPKIASLAHRSDVKGFMPDLKNTKATADYVDKGLMSMINEAINRATHTELKTTANEIIHDLETMGVGDKLKDYLNDHVNSIVSSPYRGRNPRAVKAEINTKTALSAMALALNPLNAGKNAVWGNIQALVTAQHKYGTAAGAKAYMQGLMAAVGDLTGSQSQSSLIKALGERFRDLDIPSAQLTQELGGAFSKDTRLGQMVYGLQRVTESWNNLVSAYTAAYGYMAKHGIDSVAFESLNGVAKKQAIDEAYNYGRNLAALSAREGKTGLDVHITPLGKSYNAATPKEALDIIAAISDESLKFRALTQGRFDKAGSSKAERWVKAIPVIGTPLTTLTSASLAALNATGVLAHTALYAKGAERQRAAAAMLGYLGMATAVGGILSTPVAGDVYAVGSYISDKTSQKKGKVFAESMDERFKRHAGDLAQQLGGTREAGEMVFNFFRDGALSTLTNTNFGTDQTLVGMAGSPIAGTWLVKAAKAGEKTLGAVMGDGSKAEALAQLVSVMMGTTVNRMARAGFQLYAGHPLDNIVEQNPTSAQAYGPYDAALEVVRGRSLENSKALEATFNHTGALVDPQSRVDYMKAVLSIPGIGVAGGTGAKDKLATYLGTANGGKAVKEIQREMRKAYEGAAKEIRQAREQLEKTFMSDDPITDAAGRPIADAAGQPIIGSDLMNKIARAGVDAIGNTQKPAKYKQSLLSKVDDFYARRAALQVLQKYGLPVTLSSSLPPGGMQIPIADALSKLDRDYRKVMQVEPYAVTEE